MMILGEKYDERYGFECDDYDPYDPFDGEVSDDKSDMAWVLGIEEDSEEWYMLMDL